MPVICVNERILFYVKRQRQLEGLSSFGGYNYKTSKWIGRKSLKISPENY